MRRTALTTTTMMQSATLESKLESVPPVAGVIEGSGEETVPLPVDDGMDPLAPVPVAPMAPARLLLAGLP